MKIIITEVNGSRQWEISGSLPPNMDKDSRSVFFFGLQQFYFQNYEAVVNIEVKKEPSNSFVVTGVEKGVIHGVSLE